MDESAMPRELAALLRARLHLRGGRRRLDEGKDAAGVAALYDALCSGMRWAILTAPEASLPGLKTEIDGRSDREVFMALAQAGVLDRVMEFEQVDALLDQLLTGLTPTFDRQRLLTHIEHWLHLLGVLPFDETLLPAEDPNTY
jgi:hypothetical protein